MKTKIVKLIKSDTDTRCFPPESEKRAEQRAKALALIHGCSYEECEEGYKVDAREFYKGGIRGAIE